MNPWIIVAIVVAVIIVVAIAGWLMMQKRRSDELQQQFGPEYDRTVDDTGSRRQAETVLAERRQRVRELQTRPLTDEERQSFTDRWQNVQAKFVDDPSSAVADADRLIGDAMRTRGYPTDMYEQRTDVMSVELPGAVEDYRSAHKIAQRNETGDATTEDLRTAMLKYRALFEGMVEAPATEETRA